MALKLSSKKLTFIKVLYIILCLCGLAWQFYEISDNYFSFYEVTTVRIDIPEEERAKILNFCFFFPVIKLENSPFLMTISDIFKYTPKPHEMIMRCDRVGWDQKVVSNCTMFNIRRFFIQNRMCYRMEPLFNELSSNSRNFFNPGNQNGFKMYGAFFNPNLTTLALKYQTEIHALISSSDLLPWNSFIFSNPRFINRMNPRLRIKSSAYVINRLPPPYVDNCIDYPKLHNCKDSVDCFSDCVNRLSLEKTGRSASLRHQTEGKNYTQISNFLLTEKMADDYNKIFTKCRHQYPQNDCTSITTMSITYEEFAFDPTPRDRNILEIFVRHSDIPSFTVDTNSKTVLVDFITYIFGALGTWLGFSFLGISPIGYIASKYGTNDENVQSKCDSNIIQTKINRGVKHALIQNRSYIIRLNQMLRVEKTKNEIQESKIDYLYSKLS